MNPMEKTCDPRRIDDYLLDRLTAPTLVEFEAHLDICSGCRQELEQRAAGPEMWRDAVDFLGEHRDASGEKTGDEETSVRDQQQQRVLSVLDSLVPSDDPEMLGRIGEYEVSAVVGVGGMGAVLKGFDRSLRRVVAIKVMAPHLAGSGPARTRFQREARAAAAITHDNVIDTYGVAEANGLPYLVMPFARGPSLQKRIDEGGPLTALEVVRIGRQIASGLAAAHEQGLVHRDIKPANILLNEGIERLWITDFGVARAMDDASMTQTGVIAGTPQYMSPEQARGEEVDHRSDLFSLGSVLYTACTGRPPFRSEAAYGILRRITDSQPVPIQEINPDIPNWLCRVIERLMAKHPADRIQSAHEVAELLEGCLAHLQQPTRVALPECIARPEPVAGTSLWSDSGKATTATSGKDSGRSRFRRIGIGSMGLLFALLGIAFLTWQYLEPADISGDWSGEQWSDISLASVEEAAGWYSGSFQDAAGERGVVHLEWSRLQRRYNGRWKVGELRSGSLTLRQVGDELRGAVAVDADSPVADQEPRLRELSWRRGKPVAGPQQAEPTEKMLAKQGTRPAATANKGVRDLVVQRLNQRPGSDSAALERTIDIRATRQGIVVAWGKNMRVGERISAGDLIAEMSVDPDKLAELEGAVRTAHERVKSSEQRVQSQQQLLESAVEGVAEIDAQLTTFHRIQRQIEETAAAQAEEQQAKLSAAKADLSAAEENAEAIRKEVARKQQLHDKGLISQEEIFLAQNQLREAGLKVDQAKSFIEAAHAKLVSLTNETELKILQAQVDIDKAKVERRQALAKVTLAEKEVATAKQELESEQKKLTRYQLIVDQSENPRILAPFDGVILKIANSNPVRFRGYEIICEIEPAVGRQAMVEILEVRLKFTAKKLEIARQELETRQARYEAGDLSQSELNAIEKAVRELEAEVQELKIQRDLHRRQPDDQQSGIPSERDPQEAIPRLSDEQREAYLKTLSVQFQLFVRSMDIVRDKYEQTKSMVESGDQPVSALRVAELDVADTEAVLAELKIRQEFHQRQAARKVPGEEKQSQDQEVGNQRKTKKEEAQTPRP